MSPRFPTPDPAWPPRPPEWRHDAADPPDAFPVPFSIMDAVALVIWSQLGPALVMGSVALAGVSVASGQPSLLLVLILAYSVVLAGSLAWLAGRGSLNWRLLGPVRPVWRHAGVGLGVGIAGFVIVQTVVILAHQAFGPFEPPQQELLEDTVAGGLVTVLSVVVAVVFAPVVEEVVYRGALFQALRERLGLMPGLFISGIVFAVVHVEITQPVYSFALVLLGVWLAAAFHRTGSLLVPVLGHATYNGIAVTIALLAA